jgi:hypothetical protein
MDLPSEIWGLDEIGKQPGNEVPLYQFGDIVISRIVSLQQYNAVKATACLSHDFKRFLYNSYSTCFMLSFGGVAVFLVIGDPDPEREGRSVIRRIGKLCPEVSVEPDCYSEAIKACRAFLCAWLEIEARTGLSTCVIDLLDLPWRREYREIPGIDLVLKRQKQQMWSEWLDRIPKGDPLVDLGFFKIFGKTMPPMLPLNEFLPWAVKEGLLPWEPLQG